MGVRECLLSLPASGRRRGRRTRQVPASCARRKPCNAPCVAPSSLDSTPTRQSRRARTTSRRAGRAVAPVSDVTSRRSGLHYDELARESLPPGRASDLLATSAQPCAAPWLPHADHFPSSSSRPSIAVAPWRARAVRARGQWHRLLTWKPSAQFGAPKNRKCRAQIYARAPRTNTIDQKRVEFRTTQ